MRALKRWRGLVALVRDGVEHGSRAVEKVHLEISERTFTILEAIPVVAEPARLVHEVHHTFVKGTHAVVRGVSHGVTTGVDAALGALEKEPEERE